MEDPRGTRRPKMPSNRNKRTRNTTEHVDVEAIEYAVKENNKMYNKLYPNQAPRSHGVLAGSTTSERGMVPDTVVARPSIAALQRQLGVLPHRSGPRHIGEDDDPVGPASSMMAPPPIPRVRNSLILAL